MLMERKINYLLVILLCICLSPFVLGQNMSPNEKASHTLQLVKAPKTDSQPDHNSSQDPLLAIVQEEPVVLLLCGLALLAGATVLRRIRSGGRKSASRSVESSI
jgi:hypothetical protein